MIHQSDLRDIKTIFFECADKIIAYRRQNKGMLPKDIWLKLLELNGRNFCLEILCVTKRGLPILKRRRGNASGGEKVWEGKLHIPGITVLLSNPGDELVNILINKEIVKEGNENFAIELSQKSRIWGFMFYTEPERKTTSDTLMMCLEIDPTDERFQEDLEIVTELNESEVIDQHLPVLKLYGQKPEGNVFLDTRTKKEKNY